MQRLALMSRITRGIGERQDLRSIFQVVVGSIEDELPVDFCAIGLYDMGENRLTINCVGARTRARGRPSRHERERDRPHR